MTNAELIAHLQTLPPDAPVVIQMFSEFRDLDAADLRLWPMNRHEGVWMRHDSFKLYGGTGEPTTVVLFPGN